MPRSIRFPRARRAAWTAALASAILWVGCSDAGPEGSVAGPELQRGAAADRLQELDLGPALAARERHHAALVSRAGVLGTAVGLAADGAPAVKVFTLQPGTAGIPSRVDGVPVVVEPTGMFIADATTDRTRPAPNGYSIGHPDITAGTLGAIVKRTVSGTTRFYILSNNHVMAASNDAQLGDNILQPGAFDGGSDPNDAIASLSEFEPILFDGSTNQIDAAIAEVFSPTADFVTARTDATGYGAPGSTVVTATVGLPVQKFGRTTALTNGEVTEIAVSVDVCYECSGPFCFRCTKLAHFEDQIAIADPDGGDFSQGGDSGSLIVTDDANANPVALLFAGSSTRTIGNPIQLVFDRFGVAVEDGSNLGGGDTNSPPTADFTWTASGLTVDFTDQSTDSDGSVAAWDWDFGDGNGSTAQNPTHTYAASGTYTVTLTVTDDDGATDSAQQDVTVSDDSGSDITLSVTGTKTRGVKSADLSWSGAASTNVDIYRDGSLIDTTENDGAYTDTIGRGGGSHTYQVCEAGTQTCSNEATVSF